MNANKFSDALGSIGENYVNEAVAYTAKKKRNRWLKWGAVAACFCLLLSAAIAVPVMRKNNSIISKYGKVITDSNYRYPLPGECIFFREVEDARKEYAHKNVKFLLAFDVFNSESNKLEGEELKNEYQRLADLGYKLYYVEDHWTYRGKGEKEYIPIVVGLFTEEQLANFNANEKYGYWFSFRTNGDSSSIEIDEENTVGKFNEKLY